MNNRTLKKKLKRTLKSCYFYDKEKIPFFRIPPEYAEGDVKITVAFLTTITSVIALVVLAWLLCNRVQKSVDVFNDPSNTLYLSGITVFFLSTMFCGPIQAIFWGPCKYFGTVKKMFMNTFLVDEKKRFKSTINQLMEVFVKIAESIDQHNRIVYAVNEHSISSQNLLLGKVFLYYLHRMAGIISVKQCAFEQHKIPSHAIDMETGNMLEIASLGSFCNLISSESANRGEIFKNKIVHFKDWQDVDIKHPVGFRESPES